MRKMGGDFLIDTIKIISPFVSMEVVQAIKNKMVHVTSVDHETGEELYSFTNKQLEGSYDSRISLWIHNSSVVIECSAHKVILGQNALGFIDDFDLVCDYIVSFVSNYFSVNLPVWNFWRPMRIDFAKCFDLGTNQNVSNYLDGLNNLTYPRRKVVRYQGTGVYCPGSTYTLKFYNKLAEYKKHEKMRLNKHFGNNAMMMFEELIAGFLRVELSIKNRKIKEFFGNEVTCDMITKEWLREQFEEQVDKFLKEGEESILIRTNDKVLEHLHKNCSKRLATSLYGTWFMLTTKGEDYVKKVFSKPTYYRQLKQLRDLGISWNNTDVQIQHNIINFRPSLTSSKIVNWIHEDCVKLFTFRKVS